MPTVRGTSLCVVGVYISWSSLVTGAVGYPCFCRIGTGRHSNDAVTSAVCSRIARCSGAHGMHIQVGSECTESLALHQISPSLHTKR